MAEARYLIFAFTWSGPSKIDEIKPLFDKALDWFRYAPNGWILWTNTDVNEWFKRIQPYLGPNDHLLIVEADFSEAGKTYTGWQQKWVWDWVQKHR
jgi:hypothetical protein